MKKEKRWPGAAETACLILLVLQMLLLAIILAGAIIGTVIIWFVWR